MIFYHGHKNNKGFKIEKHICSRYGFPCIFFASNIELAYNYADNSDNVIQIDFIPNHTIDYERKRTYSNDFRNLIYKLRNEGHDSVLIKNVYDNPDGNYTLELSDILVVFNLDIIKI